MKIQDKTQKQELWNKLQEFSLDNPESSFVFSHRLARENGWTKEYTNRAIEEYKKFLYLSAISGRSLTPSDEVDQVWHLHMIYTQSYWTDLCKNVLGMNFHHGPTKGGKQESVKYNDQYQFTLDLYNSEFGYSAPEDLWPSKEKRFANIVYRRVNMHENIVLNKQKVKSHMAFYLLILIGILTCGTLMSATSESRDEVDWTTTFFWVVGIIFAIFIIRGIYRYATRDERSSSSIDSRYSGYSSYSSSSSKKSSSDSKSSSSSDSSGCTITSSFLGCGSSDSGHGHGDGGHGCSSGGDSGGGDGGGCGGGGCGGCGGCGG